MSTLHVDMLRLDGVMTHEGTDVRLPAQGIVAVTGPNGAGKSALIESVAVAGWGKTLRRRPPWTKDPALCAIALRGDVTVQRTFAKGRAGLVWAQGLTPAGAFATTTKAQAALEAVLGPFGVWQRAAVFSSSDAAHFTLASDGERKRLLEDVLGLDFDDALKRVRADLKQETAQRQALDRTGIELRGRLEALRQRLADAEAALAQEPPEPPAGDAAPLLRDAKEKRTLLATVDRDIHRVHTELRKVDHAGGEHAATLKHLEAAQARIRGSSCPTCTQPIPDSLRDRLAADIATARAAQEVERKAAEVGVRALRAELEELQDDRASLDATARKLEVEARDLAARVTAAKAAGARRARAEAILGEVRVEREKLARQAARHDQEVDAVALAVAELEACEAVFGLRGLRASLLGRALAGVDAVANSYLATLGAGALQIRLRAYRETGEGVVQDAIALDLEGAGGGHYLGASSGQRRRVDVALLLGLGEVAAAAAGAPPGTLFVDEVFDALDEEGTRAAVDILSRLASERCVLCISHAPAVLEALPAVARIAVRAGHVTVH